MDKKVHKGEPVWETALLAGEPARRERGVTTSALLGLASKAHFRRLGGHDEVLVDAFPRQEGGAPAGLRAARPLGRGERENPQQKCGEET